MSVREDAGLWRRLTTGAKPIEVAVLVVTAIGVAAGIYSAFFAGSSSVTATNGGVAVGGNVGGSNISTGGRK